MSEGFEKSGEKSIPPFRKVRTSWWVIRGVVIISMVFMLVSGFQMRQRSNRAQAHIAQLNRQVENLESQAKILNGLKLKGELKIPAGGNESGVRSGLVKIISTPEIPKPTDAEYPDCLAVFEAEVMILGSDSGSVNSEILDFNVVIPAFVNREPRVGSKLKKGDWLIGRILDDDDFDGELLSQFSMADDSDRFDTKRIFLVDGEPVSGEVSEISVSLESPKVNRSKQREVDLKSLDERIELWKGDFQHWEAAAKPVRLALNQRAFHEGGELQTDDKRFSFYRAFDWPKPPFPTDVVACLSSLNDQLTERGIELVVVPVPPKNFPNVGRFVDESQLPNGGIFPYRYLIFDQLMERGIEVVDLLPALQVGLEKFPQVYYDGRDNHPADGAVQIMASEIAHRLRRYDFENRFDSVFEVPVRYSIPRVNTRFNTDSFVGDRYIATQIFPKTSSESKTFLEERVLLVGDSFAGVPLRYGVSNANLTSHLGKELGYWPEVVRVSGSAPQILPVLAQNSNLLEGTDVVVFCFFELYLYFERSKGKRYQWDIVKLPVVKGSQED